MPHTATLCFSALTRLTSARSARLSVLAFNSSSFPANVLVVALVELAPAVFRRLGSISVSEGVCGGVGFEGRILLYAHRRGHHRDTGGKIRGKMRNHAGVTSRECHNRGLVKR